MNFDIFGPYELPIINVRVNAKKTVKSLNYSKKKNDPFWIMVNEDFEGLSDACGCYVFAINTRGGGKIPWYVGKAEKQTFFSECFQPPKLSIYKQIIPINDGKPVLYFIPLMTANKKLARIGKHPEIDFVETMIIGDALIKNAKLANQQKTTYLRKLVIPGILNSQGQQKLPARLLKHTLY